MPIATAISTQSILWTPLSDPRHQHILNQFIFGPKVNTVAHPAARTLVGIARAQDAEVGDGTTSLVLLAAQLLEEVRSYIEEGLIPHIVMKGFRQAAQLVYPSFPPDCVLHWLMPVV